MTDVTAQNSRLAAHRPQLEGCNPDDYQSVKFESLCEQIADMAVTYFRCRRPGPEALLEDVVAKRLNEVFADSAYPRWVAGSLPLGAGMPDLLSVWYEPFLCCVSDFQPVDRTVMAYLRAVPSAHLNGIAESVNIAAPAVADVLHRLVEIEAVRKQRHRFSVSTGWRDVLRRIVTIEVKTANWKRAVQQAARNRIFAHQSFVALPAPVAERVGAEAVFEVLGIGILSICGDRVTIQRPAEKHEPSVWSYYFQLAAIAARHVQGQASHDLRCSTCRC